MAAVLISWTEKLWWVQPRAYMIVPTRVGVYVEVMISAAFVNASALQPQTSETFWGV